MKAIYRIAMFVSVMAIFATVLISWSETAFATSGSCTLQVDGKVFLNGICNIEMQPNGSFSVGMGDNTRSKYFASVDVDGATGVAHGMWNGKDADSHAGDDLGALKRKGACWVNQRAKVCAIAERERRSSSINNFGCSQLVTLYAMTSRAQLQCGYRFYNPAWIERSRSCSTEMGEERTNTSLHAGLKMFDDEVMQKGKGEACGSVIAAFPDAIRK